MCSGVCVKGKIFKPSIVRHSIIYLSLASQWIYDLRKALKNVRNIKFHVPGDRCPPDMESCDGTHRSTCRHIRWAAVDMDPGPQLQLHSSPVSAPGKSRRDTCQVGR